MNGRAGFGPVPFPSPSKWRKAKKKEGIKTRQLCGCMLSLARTVRRPREPRQKRFLLALVSAHIFHLPFLFNFFFVCVCACSFFPSAVLHLLLQFTSLFASFIPPERGKLEEGGVRSVAARRGIPHHRHHHRAGESGRESGPWCVRPNNSPALGLEQNTPFFFFSRCVFEEG